MPLKQGMVKWMRGGTEIKSVIQDQKRAVLRLNASHENGGIYTCVADNGIGRVNFLKIFLFKVFFYLAQFNFSIFISKKSTNNFSFT